MKSAVAPVFEHARLLVVDDDPILREFAKMALTTDRIEVEVASDGADAWNRLKSATFDIALVNLEMPVMDGFELMTLIRRHPTLRYLPILVVTGFEDMPSVDRAFAAGATGFALKPLNWRVVAYQLSYLLKAARENDRIRLKAKTLRRAVRKQDGQLANCEKGLTDMQYLLLENPLATAALAQSDSEGSIIQSLWTQIELLKHQLRSDGSG